MDFYKNLLHHYDDIFPFNSVKENFVNSYMDRGIDRVIDLGCATGGLLSYLEKIFSCDLTGIDMDSGLIEKATQRCTSRVKLIIDDMSNLLKYTNNASCQRIFCIGNTLVHLTGESQILNLLKNMHIALELKGRTIIQIINYAKFVQGDQIKSLTDIETEKIIFKRKYDRAADGVHILFTGTIIDKDTGKKSTASTELYPLEKNQFEKLLIESGFAKMEWCGDFKKNNYSIESDACIVSAEKN